MVSHTTGKEKSSSTGRGEQFLPEEDKLITKAWVRAAENGIVGANHSLGDFAEAHFDAFNLLKESIQKEWEGMKKNYGAVAR